MIIIFKDKEGNQSVYSSEPNTVLNFDERVNELTIKEIDEPISKDKLTKIFSTSFINQQKEIKSNFGNIFVNQNNELWIYDIVQDNYLAGNSIYTKRYIKLSDHNEVVKSLELMFPIYVGNIKDDNIKSKLREFEDFNNLPEFNKHIIFNRFGQMFE